ncbi:MAG: DNA repair protein RadC [Bacteroidales bacterium]
MQTGNIPIKQWAMDDRPREKMIEKGASALSNAELLAILLGSGNTEESAVEVAKKILAQAQNSLNILGTMELNDITRIKGIGPAKAITIMAAMELGRRRNKEEVLEQRKIKSSKDTFLFMSAHLSDLTHEEFWVIFLNRSLTIVSHKRISQGGIDATLADVRIIMKYCLDAYAYALIICHNHPSGNITPSNKDIELTKKIKEASGFFDIQLLDHIIIGKNNYYSFADNGIV